MANAETTTQSEPTPPQRLAVWMAGLAILPFIAYISIGYTYFLNIPYLDDLSVVLAQVNTAVSTTDLGTQIHALFTPNAGHLPVITRLVSLLQVKYLGGIDFRDSLFAANAGWIMTTLLLQFYFRRSLSLSWLALLPIPFLMLNINHWEAMDFITPAWQMYWGSVFFPVLFFIGLVEKRITLTVYAFTAAIFLSSGTLPLYPMAIAYCLFRKRWGDASSFAFRAAIPLLIFFYFNPPLNNTSNSLNIPLILKYVPAFMGNLVSTGKWDMSTIAWLHIPLGLTIIALGAVMLLTAKNADLSKLIFIYVLMLGGMAAYLRGDGFAYTVSRYALFASLAATSLYAAYAVNLQRLATNRKYIFPAAISIAVLLWLHSLLVCRTPLQLNMDGRIDGIQSYLHPESTQGNTAMLFGGNQAYIDSTLNQAKALHVYDAEQWSQ